MSNITALSTYLKAFEPYFAREGVNEVCINQPYEVWVETGSRFQSFAAPQLSLDFLWQFARLVGEYNQREISPEHPILSSVLPDGSRAQFVVEPACEKGSFICAIRRCAVKQVSIEGYFRRDRDVQQKGAFTPSSKPCNGLLDSYLTKDYVAFLRAAVLAKKNIIISGGTSTGKTTFLNALLEPIPSEERIITIETDREVKSSHPNTVHLLASEEGKSVTNTRMLDLLKASLRLRPDRILVSELRAEEAFPYLRAINSGHPGSLTTLHADSPQGAFEQLAWMALQSGCALSRKEVIDYAKSVVHVVVQIKRDSRGQRYISEVYYAEAEKVAPSFA